MLRRLAQFCFSAALGAGLLGAGSSRVYRNDAVHVRAFAAPSGWELAPQSSYPRLLASYSNHEGGKLTLSGQAVAPTMTAYSLAEQARLPLEKQGFIQVRLQRDGDRARLDAGLEGGKRFVKQLYVVDGGVGLVVTLIAPTPSAARTAADFEEAVRSLQLGSEPAAAGPDAGAAR